MSDEWRMDELYLKINQQFYNVFHLIKTYKTSSLVFLLGKSGLQHEIKVIVDIHHPL